MIVGIKPLGHFTCCGILCSTSDTVIDRKRHDASLKSKTFGNDAKHGGSIKNLIVVTEIIDRYKVDALLLQLAQMI
ncbi:hypothetical protein D3C73_759110 [compost metagenome]